MLIRFLRTAGVVLSNVVAISLVAQTPASLPPLLAQLPTPGTIVSERRVDSLGLTEWKLSNGATVFVKPTTYNEHQVLFKGVAPGGLSTLSDADYPTARWMSTIIPMLGGFGPWSMAQLREQNSGKSVAIGIGWNEVSTQVLGQAAPVDVERMLQNIYLQMTAPRYDSAEVARFLQSQKLTYAARAADPEAVLGDSVALILGNHAKDKEILTPASVSQVDPMRALAMYRNFVADASNFTFMFVGNVNLDSLKPLVARYLASLPALHRQMKAKDMVSPHGPPGVVKKVFTIGNEEYAKEFLYFFGNYDTPDDRTDLHAVSQILSSRLDAKLREELGGVYRISANAKFFPRPISSYGVVVTFDCEPSRREELVKAAFAVIDSLKRTGPTKEEIAAIVDPAIQANKLQMRTNAFWLGGVDSYVIEGRSFDAIHDQSHFMSLTPAQLQRAAQRFFNMDHYTELARVPVAETHGASEK